MRKKFLLPVLLLISVAAVAQTGSEDKTSRWSVTPHIGANLWTARYNWESDEPMDRRPGLTAGAAVGYEVVPKATVSMGVDYVLQRFALDAPVNIGMGGYSQSGAPVIATGRLYFPVMFGVNVWKGLSFSFGLQPGVTLHSNNAESVSGSELTYKTYSHTKYHFDSMHLYLPLGVSYEYRHWVADLRYFYSHKDNHWKTTSENVIIYKMTEARHAQHDSMLQLTLGYRFCL